MKRICERGLTGRFFVHIHSRKMTPEPPSRGTSTPVTPTGFDVKQPDSKHISPFTLSAAQSLVAFALETLKPHIGLKAKAEWLGPWMRAL